VQSTSSKTTSARSSSASQHVVKAIAHHRRATEDLDTAMGFTHIPDLFAAGSERLRDHYRDLEAVLAQLDAMRLQFAGYVEMAEEDARSEPSDTDLTWEIVRW